MEDRREPYLSDRGDECLAEDVRGFIDDYRTRLRVAKEKGDQHLIDFSTEGLEYYEERLANLERQIAQKNRSPVVHSEAEKENHCPMAEGENHCPAAEKENHCSAAEKENQCPTAEVGLLGRCFNTLQRAMGHGDVSLRSAGYQHLHGD